MFVFAVRRLVGAIVVLWILGSIVFFFSRFVPGGPFDQERALPPEIKANLLAKYKLDLPLHIQYINYLKDLARGDFGLSFKYIGRDVNDILKDTFPVSLHLGALALILAYLFGIPMGLISAYKQNTWIDSTSMIFAVLGITLPNFLLGAIFILVFGKYLRWFPAGLWEGAEYWVLPAVCLGIRQISYIARLFRSSVLEVIKEDYIRTARAKGLSEYPVLLKHVFKNSLIPVVTISGPLIAGIITGSFVIEQLFAIPGMAKHFVTAVQNR
ncbi:MAG TPA: ABC transporter permease, partial [Bdellovibrionota bacterium]|nr:ABC transporter permease [Bdellovibrionota bacterium]